MMAVNMFDVPTYLTSTNLLKRIMDACVASLGYWRPYQWDQMARLFVKYLAIYNNENFPIA